MKLRACYIALCLSLPVMADDLSLIRDSGDGSNGVLSVNQAAGEQNQQANLRALAIGDQASHASLTLSQGLAGAGPQAPERQASASIDGASFAGFSGMLGVNQTSGYANRSANLAAVAVGPWARTEITVARPGQLGQADDTLLAQSTGATEDPQQNSAPLPTAEIGDRAFQGAAGVVQLNQVAGSLNQAANLLAVRVLQ
ncbi:adhesin [Crenobacter cavernae]|uniref:Adhesin n=1 Tax=Crenobacter cavernae TaxID=2290923 RepID=A0ABY0FHP0_9NEIS|nr:adhesin [Crenobacter cavernae]RXZ44931.1 adhesin [Crenobacter cavernae]